jgi:alpha-ketoglutarate-dependent taurine dioxygenase
VSDEPRRWDAGLLDRLDECTIDGELAPELGAVVLDEIRRRGFVLIRSSPAATSADGIDRRRDELLAFGATLGTPVIQSLRDELVEDVKDYSDLERDDRGYRSRGELSPHSDPPTLLVLHCLQPARSGGESAIVSVSSIVERLNADDPTAVDTLRRDFPQWDVVGEYGAVEAGPSRYARPILTEHRGQVSCVIYRPFIEQAAEALGTPLSAAQVAALDAWERASTSAELALRFTMQAGQTLILHNRSVLHARTDYEDWPDFDRRRHLLRMWIDAPREFPTDPRHALGDLYGPS